tara:strand:+ start:2150 stop:3388 length:1239 start_codon:yes stop_codon:yes gene_type:complete
MIFIKKRKKSIDKSNIYAFFLSVFSLFSGIIGYNLSIFQNQDLASSYIYSLSFSFLIQMILSSVLNYRKNAILSRFKYHINIRNSILQFVFLNLIITMTLIIIALLFVNRSIYDLVILFLFQMIFSYLQILTFNKSIFFQLKNVELFLKIQFYGSLVKVTLVLILVFYFKLSFWGLIISNIFTAIAISLLYGIKFDELTENYKLGLKKLKLINCVFKVEGFLRSYRGYSEAWMLTTVISVLNFLKFLKPTELEILNFSVPYINTISTQFRQVFIKFERESYLKMLNKYKVIVPYFTLLPMFLIILWKNKFILIFEKLEFYSVLNIFNDNFLLLVSFLLFLLPLTLGYSYIDYAIKRNYYIFLVKKVTTMFILFAVVLLIYNFSKANYIFIILPLIPTISIVLNRKYLVEKYI